MGLWLRKPGYKAAPLRLSALQAASTVPLRDASQRPLFAVAPLDVLVTRDEHGACCRARAPYVEGVGRQQGSCHWDIGKIAIAHTRVGRRVRHPWRSPDLLPLRRALHLCRRVANDHGTL